MKTGAHKQSSTLSGAIPPVSPLLLRLFYLYCRRYVRRHFHGLRIAKGQEFPQSGGPLVVYLNHPSWWDPLICLILALRFLPDRRHHAPIDAAELERYRFFSRLGFFGIERGTFGGAAAFLRTAETILKNPGGTLWLTPEGRFSDPRSRPTRIAPGLGHLARRMKQGVLLPLALEYPFWDERSPEVLVSPGAPIEAGRFAGLAPRRATELLAGELEHAQDELGRRARERDPAGFETVLEGKAGGVGAYDLGRRFRAWRAGETFRPEHTGGGPDA